MEQIRDVLELLRFDRGIIKTAVDGLTSTADEVEDRYNP